MATNNSTSTTGYSQDVSKEILSRLIAEQQTTPKNETKTVAQTSTGFCPAAPSYFPDWIDSMDLFYNCPEVTMDGHDPNSIALSVKDLASDGISSKTVLYNYFQTLKKMSDLLGGTNTPKVYCDSIWNNEADGWQPRTCAAADNLIGLLANLVNPITPEKFEEFVRTVFNDPLVKGNLELTTVLVAMTRGEGLANPSSWPQFKTNLYQSITLFKTLPNAFTLGTDPAIPNGSIDWKRLKPDAIGAEMGLALSQSVSEMKDADTTAFTEYLEGMNSVITFLNFIFELDIMRGRVSGDGIFDQMLLNLSPVVVDNLLLYDRENGYRLTEGLRSTLIRYRDESL